MDELKGLCSDSGKWEDLVPMGRSSWGKMIYMCKHCTLMGMAQELQYHMGEQELVSQGLGSGVAPYYYQKGGHVKHWIPSG